MQQPDPQPLEGILEEAPSTLVSVPPLDVMTIFSTPGALDSLVDAVAAKVKEIPPADIATPAGRKEMAALAYRVTRTKTYLDGIGKELVADLKDLPRRIDSHRKLMRERLDEIAATVRQPLTAWEAEQERRRQILVDVEMMPMHMQGAPAAALQKQIALLDARGPEDEDPEFIEAFQSSKVTAMAGLCEMLRAQEKVEADATELAQLRQQKDERDRLDREEEIRRQAEQKARREAEDRATAERDASLRREAQAKLDAQLAEQRAKDAEARAEQERKDAAAREERAAQEATRKEQERQEAERRRVEEGQRREQAAKDALAADVEHRRAFNREAMENLLALTAGDEDLAKAILLAIVKGQVRHIAITY